MPPFSLSPILIEKGVLGSILAVVLVVFVVMSLVFRYHWREFGLPTPVFRAMKRWYFIVSTILATCAVAFYLAILLTL